ncbi:LysR family transcriptional regulator [Actinomadura rudentiformis]|uniref:LysR family transcriptional regulator n=1 Tax=Actinomadura rudentiformis TaxID=359158 RepID=A0A6H9YRF2_9ACTN|nr:LysR family transcriptional regulator [Actinomadura rudentiformis]KAB2343615.1 LysR family transcriptional regulator [Actinomadura rudentiformis]
MELREIEIFLTLAEDLHFGRAAERMYLSQSRVSQTIRAMETRVGGRLRPGFEQIHLAFAEAREIASGITGVLRVSLLNFAAGGPAFPEIVRAFTTAHPGCRTRLCHRGGPRRPPRGQGMVPAETLETLYPPLTTAGRPSSAAIGRAE